MDNFIFILKFLIWFVLGASALNIDNFFISGIFGIIISIIMNYPLDKS